MTLSLTQSQSYQLLLGLVLYQGQYTGIARGGIVYNVKPDSLASSFGLRRGDLITSVQTVSGIYEVVDGKAAKHLLMDSRDFVTKIQIRRARHVQEAVACTQIQAALAGHTTRLVLSDIVGPELGRRWKRAAIIIQKSYRRFDARRCVLGMIMAAYYIQTAARRYIARSCLASKRMFVPLNVPERAVKTSASPRSPASIYSERLAFLYTDE